MKIFVLSTPYNESCVIPFLYNLGVDIVVLKEHHLASDFAFPVQLSNSINEATLDSDYTIFINSPQLKYSVIKSMNELKTQGKCYICDEQMLTNVRAITQKNNKPNVLILGWGASAETLSLELQLLVVLSNQGIMLNGILSTGGEYFVNLINNLDLNHKIILNEQSDVNIHVVPNCNDLSFESFSRIIDITSPDYVILCVESADDLDSCVEILWYRWGIYIDSIVKSNYFTYECYGKKYNIMGKPGNINDLTSIMIKNKEIPIFKNTIDCVEKIFRNITMKISLPDGVCKI